MPGAHSQFPEADRIIEEVLQGKRVFALWPGTGMVVTIIMLHVLSMGIWLGPTYFAAVPWFRDHHWPWEPLLLLALALCTTSIGVPAFLLVRGAPSGFTVLKAVTRAWFASAVLTAGAVALGSIGSPLWPYIVSAVALAAGYALEQSESCLIYVVLRQRLAVKLAERKQNGGS